jgi:hypothetical protein
MTTERRDTCPEERNQHWDPYHDEKDDLVHLSV